MLRITPQIIDWVKGTGKWKNKKLLPSLKDEEKRWGCKIINKNSKMWSSVLGEKIVERCLSNKGVKVWRPKNKNKFKPDWETEKYIYEVKTRNWTTPGTAGEKILGVPFKYSQVPILYKKPLRIILVGYQEFEAERFHVFNPKCRNQKKMLKLWNDMGITFMRCSDIIE